MKHDVNNTQQAESVQDRLPVGFERRTRHADLLPRVTRFLQDDEATFTSSLRKTVVLFYASLTNLIGGRK